jgi:hypothetical protein
LRIAWLHLIDGANHGLLDLVHVRGFQGFNLGDVRDLPRLGVSLPLAEKGQTYYVCPLALATLNKRV